MLSGYQGREGRGARLLSTLARLVVAISLASRSRQPRRYQLIRPSMPELSPDDSEALKALIGMYGEGIVEQYAKAVRIPHAPCYSR